MNKVLRRKAVPVIEPKREMHNDKPVVMYSEVQDQVAVGMRAILCPIDHYKERFNGRVVSTSTVQAANLNTGVIETRYTVYKPHPSTPKPYFVLT